MLLRNLSKYFSFSFKTMRFTVFKYIALNANDIEMIGLVYTIILKIAL